MSAESAKSAEPQFVPAQRGSEYDVTGTVRVSDASAVRSAVHELFRASWPGAPFDTLWIAFHDFEQLFRGRFPGYEACDTVYHDIQHSLDVTLAMARLLTGYERTAPRSKNLGWERVLVGLVAALFHDAGYIRSRGDRAHRNGAEHTLWHISRSAAFLRDYLPRLGLAQHVPVAEQLVHFTGYERSIDQIERGLDDPLDILTGSLLGTADLLAQMADRCYLEKCRDRLYAEFVLGGVAIRISHGQVTDVLYESGLDLLRKTPDFWQETALTRLDGAFDRAYRYMEPLFEGHNPYMQAIRQNLDYLDEVIQKDDWGHLRRHPPCHTGSADGLEQSNAHMNRILAEVAALPVAAG